MLRRPFPSIAFAIFALTLIAAPTSTKIGGLAWVLLCLMGLWALIKSERTQAKEVGAHYLNKSIDFNTSAVEEAARIWVLACLAAAAIRFIPHAFWHDEWDRRHADFRLILGALATVALVKWPPFYRLMGSQKLVLGYSLALACIIGFCVTALHGRETPVHAIAWAVSLSFLVCLLAPKLLDAGVPSVHRKFWLLGVLMGAMAIVLSQSRGVYGILIWLVLAGFIAASNRTMLKFSNFRARTWVVLSLLFFALIWILNTQPPWLTAVSQRISEAWVEASMSQSNPGEAANTSVGSRLFLWSKALDAIEVQPWFGYGKENSIAMIKQWGLEVNSDQVQKLGHLHHEFLDAWVSHGLMGILSLLVLATGMGLVVRKLWVPHPSVAQGILGILFMHLTAGLSNTNMVHNYYGAMLSLSISLALVMAASEESRQ